jgi:CTP:molybdopterin cytidylyltransferase MocA
MGCLLKQGGGLYARMRIGAVLLAAGQGSRLGNQPKALLELQGVPLINRHLIALSGAGVDEVVVVTGFYHEQVEPLVEQFPVQIVRNLNPGAGQPSSVRLGIETLGDKFDAVIMVLCDQPLVSANDITTLIAAFKKRLFGEIVIPQVNGTRGNPIVLSGAAIAQILAEDQNMYCRKFIDEHPEQVSYFESDNQHYVTDIDTQADIEKFEQNTGWTLTLPDQNPIADSALTPKSVVSSEPAYLALRRRHAVT